MRMDIKKLMEETDINVKKLVETFRFTLKYRILFRGGGIEFAGLKQYTPGEDDATKIDWKASLRTGRLYVRQYEEERDLDVFILCDVCSSMVFGTQEKLKNEYAAIVAGTLAHCAIEVGENVGFVAYSDKIKYFLPPICDTVQYYEILRILADPSTYGGKCDLREALSYVLNNIEEKTVLFIISDFIGLEEGWEDSLRMASAKFAKVIGIMVRDLRDEYLPKGVGRIRLKDPFSEKILIVDIEKIREKYEKLAEEQTKKIIKNFLESKAGLIKVFTHEPFVKPLANYLELTYEG
jgi:uncharacterized protein (DUF58 family)